MDVASNDAPAQEVGARDDDRQAPRQDDAHLGGGGTSGRRPPQQLVRSVDVGGLADARYELHDASAACSRSSMRMNASIESGQALPAAMYLNPCCCTR